MNDINLIRKLAWNFYHRTVDIEYDDLFQEATLTYYEALPLYDESKGALSTYMFHCIKNHLGNYCTNEQKHSAKGYQENLETKTRENFLTSGYTEENFLIPKYTGLMREVVEMIINDPEEDYNYGPKKCWGIIVRKLREEKKWKWDLIRATMRDMKAIARTV